MATLKDIVKSINESPTGSMVGITDYVSKTGKITSITGQIGVSYTTVREQSIRGLKEAIKDRNFDEITVEGQCYELNGEYNPRKRSWDMKPFKVTYTVDEVISMANKILNDWENPKVRKSNGINVSDKERGMVFNPETMTFNIAILVQHETFKGTIEENVEKKPKAKSPETCCNELIRKRFNKTIKTYTISSNNFKIISIGGTRYKSDEITL